MRTVRTAPFPRPLTALPKLFSATTLSLALGLGIPGCTRAQTATQTASASADPASVNDAPAAEGNCPAGQVLMSDGSCAGTGNAQAQPVAGAPASQHPASSTATAQPVQAQYPQQAQPAPIPDDDDLDPSLYDTDNVYDNQSYAQDANDQGYQQGYEQDIQATQPPPPLPVYAQPSCPGPGYLWTPGYWSYAPSGYYWVPGAWTPAPYAGALWTPGWWGFLGSLFRWHPGYWGSHIGFYGGVPYGYGYTGDGFHGGYWSGNRFYYNRAVTNINVTNITNVYNRTVVNNMVTNRISYNGGRGGLSVRPTMSQFAAMREPHVRPLPAQAEHQTLAMQNRQQYARRGGSPAMLAAPRPLAAHPIRPVSTVVNPGVHGATRPTTVFQRQTPAAAHPTVVPGARPATPQQIGAHPTVPSRTQSPTPPQVHNQMRARAPQPMTRPQPTHTQPATRQNPRPQFEHSAPQPRAPQTHAPERRNVPNAHAPAPPSYAAPREQRPQYSQPQRETPQQAPHNDHQAPRDEHPHR